MGAHRGAAVSRPASVITQAPVARKVVALTFDDGPPRRWTPKILAVLNAAHVKATFFVIASQARKYAGLVAHYVRDGMEVGSHGALQPAPRKPRRRVCPHRGGDGGCRHHGSGRAQAALLLPAGRCARRHGPPDSPQDWRHRWAGGPMLAIVKRSGRPPRRVG